MDLGITGYSLLGFHTSRFREYQFAFRNIPSKRCKILDVGSSGSLFALKLARLGHHVYSIDAREYDESHKNLITCQGDVRDYTFEEGFFDIITCISTIEHIGLSAYGDPSYDDGDKIVMQKFHHVLKKSGKLIITMPFAGKSKLLQWERTIERIYDWQQLDYLFDSWGVLHEEYYIPQRSGKNWIIADRKNAEMEFFEYPRSNLACFVLERCD